MNKTSEDFSDKVSVFKRVLTLLEYQLKALKKIGVNSDLISVYGSLLQYLRTLNSDQIKVFLERKHVSREERSEDNEYDEQLFKLNLDEIKLIVQSEESTRKYLEKIATVRFGMTKGELSSISNRSRLVEQLTMLINNEEAHKSIKRMASSKEEIYRR